MGICVLASLWDCVHCLWEDFNPPATDVYFHGDPGPSAMSWPLWGAESPLNGFMGSDGRRWLRGATASPATVLAIHFDTTSDHHAGLAGAEGVAGGRDHLPIGWWD
jgi:hypothetical protein